MYLFLPAQDAEDEIEHEEGADDDEGNEEDPVEHRAESIIGLKFESVVQDHDSDRGGSSTADRVVAPATRGHWVRMQPVVILFILNN